MLGKVFIDEVYQCSLRCRFAGTGWTGHEHESATQVSEVLDGYRNAQIFERRNPCWNQSKRCGVTFRLLEVVGSKSRVLIHLVGKIKIAALVKRFPVTRTANFAQHPRGFVVRNRLDADRHDVALRSDFWGLPLSDMQIRCTLAGDDLQELIKIRHCMCSTISGAAARYVFDLLVHRLLLR